jgi:hypothetical protein
MVPELDDTLAREPDDTPARVSSASAASADIPAAALAQAHNPAAARSSPELAYTPAANCPASAERHSFHHPD